MDKNLARLAYAALASSALAPGCGASDAHRSTGEGDASPDGSGAGGSGMNDSGISGKGGRAGGTGSGGRGGTAVDAGSGGKGGVDAAPSTDASLDGGALLADAQGSCAPDDSDATPPTLSSATLIAPDEIRLTFSEPVQVPAGVDPTRFRLSIGTTQQLEGFHVSLYDVATLLGPDGGAGYAVSSIAGACGPSLTARLTTPLPLDHLCRELVSLAQNPAAIAGETGLFLHFRDAGSPTVEDRAGLPLVAVSPAWATPLDGGALQTTFDQFQAAPIDALRIPVRCGDAGF